MNLGQRQPLNFPTQWDNFGGSLFLLSLLLPVFTHTRAKCFRKTKEQRDRTRQTFDFEDDERMRERRKETRKRTHVATRDRILRLPGPPLSISRRILHATLISLTDKPAGARDANLQLLLRPVRLGAVDPSQGVLLARGVRSFRISHILSSYACDCLVVEDVFVRTRRFGRERTRRRKKVRREQQAKEGERERGREREEERFFIFFVGSASFSTMMHSLCFLSFLSFSCVFTSNAFSLSARNHTSLVRLSFFWRRLKAPIIVVVSIFPHYI